MGSGQWAVGSGGAADGVVSAVDADGLVGPDERVVVLISGGRDSTCLLDVCVRVAGAAAVAALHVDYGIRPESGEDARACAALCERLGVPLSVERPQRAPAAGNFHAWARDVRYAAGARLAVDHRSVVATGHTASDQVETILYRLASSPGRRALLGIARERDLHGCRVVRPLLGITREQTTAYCRARGLDWREDATNDAPRYARARVRGGLLPALAAVHPAAAENVVRTSALLADEAAALDAIVAEEIESDGTALLSGLRALPRAIARLVVQRLADEAAGGLASGVARRTEDILALPDPGALDVGHGVRALVRDGRLNMGPTPRDDGELARAGRP